MLQDMINPLELLFDEESVKKEVTEFFGGFDPLRWDLDAGIDERFKACLVEGGDPEEFARHEDGFVYQSCWNQVRNDERSKYLAMVRYMVDNGLTSMLDYGCGIGTGPLIAAIYGMHAVAVDICEPCLEFLKYRRDWMKEYRDLGLTVINGDSKGRWDWHKQRVDLAMCTEVFEHVNRPDQLAVELAEIVNPGGALILSWSFVPMPGHIPEHFNTKRAERGLPIWQHTHGDLVDKEGFGYEVLIKQLGLEYVKHSWFNNTIWRKP